MSHPPSSDDLRIATPLRHARLWTSPEPLELENGGRLPELNVCYETWGELDERGENAVLVCHAISGDSHVARHDEGDDPGSGDDEQSADRSDAGSCSGDEERHGWSWAHSAVHECGDEWE